MIRSFADKETERIWNGDLSRRLPNQIQALARRKLRMLDAAQRLDDLRIPPANRLETLKDKRTGQHSNLSDFGVQLNNLAACGRRIRCFR